MIRSKGKKFRLGILALIGFSLFLSFYALALNRAAFEDYFFTLIAQAVLAASVWFGLTLGVIFGLLGILLYSSYYLFQAQMLHMGYDIGARDVVWLSDFAAAGILGGWVGEQIHFLRRLFKTYHTQIESLLMTGQLGMMGDEPMFRRDLGEECARSRRSLSQFTLVMLDLGNQDEVQKLLGVDGPEEAAGRISKAICAHTRDIDKKSKLGLTRFSVILPGCRRDQAPIVLERIQNNLNKVTTEYRGRIFNLEIRIVAGMAQYPEDGDQSEKLTAIAEHDLEENLKVGSPPRGSDSEGKSGKSHS